MSNHSSHILKYRVIGNGHPVVFLHGYLESMSMWNELNRESYQCIDIDLHGHGASADVPVPDTLEKIAIHVQSILTELKIGSYSLVGHSMGGYVGLELLEKDPNCQKLVLLNSNFWKDTDRKVTDRKRVAKIVEKNASLFLYEAIPNLFLDPERYDDKVRLLITEALELSPKEIGNASLAMSKRRDHTNTVRSNAKNVCVIQGEQDPIVSRDQMKSSIAELGITYFELPHVGHMAHIEASQVVTSLLKRFLKLS